ncbi:MAG: beta-lactamase family protein [Candidatus Dormibacteraeota bacterium]|nr:beta-lactamase family protein [Candidatus Dormibacteraeota bacterium]
MTAIRPEVSPEEVGLDSRRLERLSRHLRKYVDEGRRPGTLTVISRGGRIAYVDAIGHRDLEHGLPVETDTIWRIYSMTKPVTSVAAMMLVEEGALSLSDPVEKFIPSFANTRVYRTGPAVAPITAPASEQMLIWHLFTHTSGLSYAFFDANPVEQMVRMAGFVLGAPEDFTLTEASDRLASLPLLFEPGAAWNYSYSVDVLARVIEVVSGHTLDEFFRERIFEPLGMTDTRHWVPEADRGRLSVLYAPNPQTGGLSPNLQADRLQRERPRLTPGGHGLASTAADYHRFTQMLLRRGELDGVRLLSPRTVDLMTSNHLPDGADIATYGYPSILTTRYQGRGFGLGVAPLTDPVAARSLSSRGEYSWGGAAGTAFWVDPEKELVVLFFTQVLFSREPLDEELRTLVYQALVA